MEVSLSACRVRAEYVDKHVRSIWTLPDIISTDSYAWALAATSNACNDSFGTTVTSARGDPIILSVATGVEGATASIGSTLKLPNSMYIHKKWPKKALFRFRIVPRVALRARGLVGSVFVSLFL